MVYAPTVRPAENFSADEDAKVLKAAMKGMGTQEGPIVQVLARRGYKQREQIAQAYKREFGRDLAEDLKKELGGDLEDLMMGLTYNYFEYLSHELNGAFKLTGVKEKVLNEIILSRNNAELHLLKEAYGPACHSSLDEDIRKGMSGDLEKILVAILNNSRNEIGEVDTEKAKFQAQDLYKAGEKKFGTDEAIFRNVFSQESLPQLLAVEAEYAKISKRTLREAINSELGGGFASALIMLLDVATDKIKFYTDLLYNSMQGAGTDDKTLIRVVLSRSELDLGAIMSRYLQDYGKTLDHSIERETSGPYKEALLLLTRGA